MLKQALRVLFNRRSIGFTVVAVLLLALGIGANTTIFSMVQSILIHPLPFSDSNRLVGVWEKPPGNPTNEVSPANFIDWRDQNKVFEGIGALSFWNVNITGGDQPERVQGFQVSPGLFDLLGTPPLLGRGLRSDDDQPGNSSVVVLSYGLWTRRFGGDPNVLGKTLTLNAVKYTVVGVMPAAFQIHRGADLWAPLVFSPAARASRRSHYLIVMGRLKSDVSLVEARRSMEQMAAHMAEQYPDTNKDWSVTIDPLYDQTVGRVRPALLLMLAAVGVVLLLTCANIANLLLARSDSRQKEIALRLALGSGRMRIVQQLLTESVLLGVLGGVGGLLIAVWSLKALRAIMPPSVSFDLPTAMNVTVNLPVLFFALLISVIAGAMVGLAPALRALRSDINETLKETGGHVSRADGPFSLRKILVVSQVAMTMVLLISAGLLVHSLFAILSVDPGFRTENAKVMTMRVTLPFAKYRTNSDVRGMFDRILERVRPLPGVSDAALISDLPLGGSNSSTTFTIEGQPPLPTGQHMEADYRVVSADYFRLIGIPLRAGRAFGAADTADGAGVAIISDSLASHFFQGMSPIGQRIDVGSPGKPKWCEVVGIAGDVKHWGLDSQPRPTMYFPYSQQPQNSLVLTVRSQMDAANLAMPIRSAILAVDSDQPVSNVQTLQQVVDTSIALQRMTAGLVGLFAGVALLLAAIGLYGVLSYNVVQRTHEIGIRLAIGARRQDVVNLIVGQGVRLIGVGVALGLVAAYGLSKLLQSLLFGVDAHDPLTFAGISLLIVVVALIAAYLPARRASRLDPTTALRYE